jgi:hypothetical protein
MDDMGEHCSTGTEEVNRDRSNLVSLSGGRTISGQNSEKPLLSVTDTVVRQGGITQVMKQRR